MGDDAPRALHMFGDTLAQTRQRLALILCRGDPCGRPAYHLLIRSYRRWRRCKPYILWLNTVLGLGGGSLSFFGVGAYVFERDTAAWAGRSDSLQVNAQFERKFTYGRYSQGAWSI